MKRGGCDHPKIRRLGRKLGVPRLHAIGMIEVVIEFARRYASDGDLGRHDPEDLAQACDWERDPQELIDGLIETGWLDPGPPLFIHDWHIHADDATRKSLERRGVAEFANGAPVRTVSRRYLDSVATKSAEIATVSRQSRASPSSSSSSSSSPSSSTKKKKAAKRPLKEVPAEFTEEETSKLAEFVRSEGLRLSQPLSSVLGSCLDYHRSRGNPKGYSDWIAVARNWLRKDQEFGRQKVDEGSNNRGYQTLDELEAKWKLDVELQGGSGPPVDQGRRGSVKTEAGPLGGEPSRRSPRAPS